MPHSGEPPDETEADDLAAPAALLRTAWRESDTVTEAGAEVVGELLDHAGPTAFSDGSAALAPAEAICLAVLGEDDGVIQADPAFRSWFPDPLAMPELRRLAGQARGGRASLGLLETIDGAMVAAWVAAGDEAAKMARDGETRQALVGRKRVLAVVFAPSRSSDLAARAVAAFGLSPLQSRLAEAFLFAPTLEIAATQVGIGRETARDALDGIMSKLGVRRSAEIVRRLSDLMCAAPDHSGSSPEMLMQAFGLTRSEAGVALQIAAGATHREAADALGLKFETVRTYAKAALAKAGVSRAKDLARLTAETEALSKLVSAAEPVFVSGAPPARLRLIPRPEGRQAAFLDYGPRSGRPAFVFHGFTAGRSLPPALVAGLHARGLRPLVVQRPGFGLTSPAGDDYLACSTADLEGLIDALGAGKVALFARDGGVAAALDFAARNPDRIARGVLLNPRPPAGLPSSYRGKPVFTMTRLILGQPQVIAGLGEFIRRRTRSDFLDAAIRQTLSAIPEDRAALEDPAIRSQLVRDIQAQFAHSSAGYAAEHGLYARHWRAPRVEGGGPWTILHCGALGVEPARDPWLDLPGVDFRTLPAAGVLAQFTHADAIAGVLAERP